MSFRQDDFLEIKCFYSFCDAWFSNIEELSLVEFSIRQCITLPCDHLIDVCSSFNNQCSDFLYKIANYFISVNNVSTKRDHFDTVLFMKYEKNGAVLPRFL